MPSSIVSTLATAVALSLAALNPVPPAQAAADSSAPAIAQQVTAEQNPEVKGSSRSTHPIRGNALRFADTANFMAAGVKWPVDGPEVTRVQMRVKEAAGFGEWETLEINDADTAVDGYIGTQPLVTNGARGVQVRLSTADGSAVEGATLDLVDPGTFALDGVAPASTTAYTPATTSQVGTLKTSVVPRSGWGADASVFKDFGTQITPQALVIHHTASSNNYTPEQASAQVRAIYMYQAKSLGWGDIGYNFLVDKYGTKYEGRAGSLDKVRTGAHTAGFNHATLAISALGNYEEVDAPDALVKSIISLGAWQMAKYGIDPAGTTKLTAKNVGWSTRYAAGQSVTLPTIFGHITTSNTLCSGKNLIADLPAIKSQITSKINAAKAPATKTPTAPSTSGSTYTVKPGDSWWTISTRLGMSMTTLAKINGMTTSTTIHPGQVLKTSQSTAPAPSTAKTYTVKSGDSWWTISTRLGVSMDALARLNGKTTSTVLHPGMVLKTL